MPPLQNQYMPSRGWEDKICNLRCTEHQPALLRPTSISSTILPKHRGMMPKAISVLPTRGIPRVIEAITTRAICRYTYFFAVWNGFWGAVQTKKFTCLQILPLLFWRWIIMRCLTANCFKRNERSVSLLGDTGYFKSFEWRHCLLLFYKNLVNFLHLRSCLCECVYFNEFFRVLWLHLGQQ